LEGVDERVHRRGTVRKIAQLLQTLPALDEHCGEELPPIGRLFVLETIAYLGDRAGHDLAERPLLCVA
jgi:hypothetical protein